MPGCPIGFLWRELDDGAAVKLAEVAHIVAAGEKGPRSDREATETELTSFQNLILLCPNCHTIVDAAPNLYSVESMREWKHAHESRVKEILGVVRYHSRAQLQREIAILLDENRQIWQTYGPESVAANMSMVSDVSSVWRREVVGRVLPNNARVLHLLEGNIDLLRKDELPVVNKFRMHVRSMEDRHLGGILNQAAPRFPSEMDHLLKGGSS
jgi:hypothetical protein